VSRPLNFDYSTYGTVKAVLERLRLDYNTCWSNSLCDSARETKRKRLSSELTVREHVASANDLEERIRPSHSCDDLKLLLHADGAYYRSWVAGQTSVRNDTAA
jgi:hypothetical protein